MTDLNQLEIIAADVADYYNRVHKVIKFSGNSVQSYRTADITLTHEDSIRESSVRDGMKVLDAGFGLGAFDHYLASKMNCDISAVSFSEAEVEAAGKLYGNQPVKGKLNFIHADFHFLKNKFEDNTFDMVMFLESFEHAHDKEKVLRDSYSLIKQGGYLFLKFHFLLWHNAKGREEAFNASVQMETDSMKIFTHITLPDFLKLTSEIGFIPQLVKIPGIKFDYYEASMQSVEQCNRLVEGFHYVQPNFQVTQCYNVLLQKQ
jgi:ubiquinone/menaquinone biosynthesis C-methylase UbiE